MKKERYIALMNYRNNLKYYYVSYSEDNHIRIEYLNYNPNSEWNGIWVKNGKSKILKTFDSSTEIYKYFLTVYRKFILNVRNMEKDNAEKRRQAIGLRYMLICYKKAVKEVPNPLGITIKQS